MKRCARADHPPDPHYHYGYGGAHWARDFPHWDVDASTVLHAREIPPTVHPDMDYDEGWRS